MSDDVQQRRYLEVVRGTAGLTAHNARMERLWCAIDEYATARAMWAAVPEDMEPKDDDVMGAVFDYYQGKRTALEERLREMSERP